MMKIKFNIDNYHIEDSNPEVKESFKFILSKSEGFIRKFTTPKVADVGCATGTFLSYFKTLYPDSELTGYDIDNEMLKKASENVHNAKFKKIDITKIYETPVELFNIVYMGGLLLYFEDIENVLKNFISLIASGGRGYIFGTFNPEPLDLLVKVRYVNHENEKYGFITHGNTFSFYTISKILKTLGAKFNFHEFKFNKEIVKSKDPIRTWTFKLEDGSIAIKNGAQIIHNFYLLEIIPEVK